MDSQSKCEKEEVQPTESLINQSKQKFRQNESAKNIHDIQIQQQNPELNNTEWQNFSWKHKFNPKSGFLVSPSIELEKPEFTKIKEIVKQLPNFKNSSQLKKEIQECPIIQLESFNKTQQMIKFRDMLTYIEGTYLRLERSQGKKDSQIELPYPLSKFISEISNQLGIKKGPTTGLSSNWKVDESQQKKPIEDYCLKLTMQNLNCQYFYTKYPDQQILFFGTSIVASLHLVKVIESCFLINKIIRDNKTSQDQKMDFILKNFEEIQQKWNLIYDLMVNLSEKLDPQIFFHQLRPYLMGFQNIRFQSYDGLFSSGGGSAGEDPCYQIFERAMGIEISQAFSRVQVKLREGMYQAHIDMQDFFKKNSLIKSYCLSNNCLTEAYQKVLKTYTKMNCFHNIFINKFILAFIPSEKHSTSYGAGGNLITDVKDRWKVLDEKNSLGMHKKSNDMSEGESQK